MSTATLRGWIGAAVLAWGAGTGWAEDARGPELVTRVADVTCSIEKKNPPNLVVEAEGVVPTGGYRKGRLARVVYAAPPSDGIQDYYFTAVPPAPGTIVTQAEAEIESKPNRWRGYTEEADWVRGVRVHAREGSVVRMLADDEGDGEDENDGEEGEEDEDEEENRTDENAENEDGADEGDDSGDDSDGHFEGVSANGSIQEALDAAVAAAQAELGRGGADIQIRWELVSTSGTHGGIAGTNEVVVVIAAAGPDDGDDDDGDQDDGDEEENGEEAEEE